MERKEKVREVMIRKMKEGVIPTAVMEFALDEMQKILWGEVIFVSQNGRLMQVEVMQRRRVADWSEKILPWSEEACSILKVQIEREFSTLSYGRLVVKIQGGRVSQMERTVQSRFTGLDGEGI